ncbi:MULTISPECIES: DMT family transporter [unclassified Azospirillum]|uniref:DMT family transporter n=1 Tax=unclassified Azospirillum TaxID=2630922 RepID=UPI000B6EC2DE|nr:MULTISPECIES: DMT family transporter [unclassified Azospirillum]SNR95991.1 Permease of the drug/metabolite transporter (DMT) superfamily [Azospirillum sp. RU38E]SNS12682.1 Permease of the drug/metabolite transporter (DMT) superfamily [Azospirillum sp. RU37A]
MPVSLLPPAGSTGRAILAMIGAVALFSTMNAMIKSLAGHYPLGEIVFFRALFAMVILLPVIWRAGGLATLRTDRPWGHVLRSIIGVISMTCGFTAISLLPLANAAAFAFTAPLWTTTLGVLILGEKVRWRRALALITGFTGVLIMVRPDGELLRQIAAGGEAALGCAFALASAALAACAMISVRRLSATERSSTIVFYFMLTGCFYGPLLAGGDFRLPTGHDALVLVAIGLVGGVAQLLLTSAYRGAPVAVIAPFDYSAMLWATGYGFLIWGEVPDSRVMLGALIVVSSGIYITVREARLGQTPAPAPQLLTKMG